MILSKIFGFNSIVKHIFQLLYGRSCDPILLLLKLVTRIDPINDTFGTPEEFYSQILLHQFSILSYLLSISFAILFPIIFSLRSIIVLVILLGSVENFSLIIAGLLFLYFE